MGQGAQGEREIRQDCAFVRASELVPTVTRK